MMKWQWMMLSTLLIAKAQAIEPLVTPVVNVIFGQNSLLANTPVNSQVPFIEKTVSLPALSCTSCDASSHWQSHWSVLQTALLPQYSQPEQGQYLFSSGVNGIGIRINAPNQLLAGQGMPSQQADLLIGLVRLTEHNGAGLVSLPAAKFIRETRFTDETGKLIAMQQDTLQVSASLTVPTCVSNSSDLQFTLADIDQGELQRLRPGEYTEKFASPPQILLADCSPNTQHVKIDFIPLTEVSAGTNGAADILVGHDRLGESTGTGYVVTYQAQGFGQQQSGVVQWGVTTPLMLHNDTIKPSLGVLSANVRVTLQAFYARVANQQPISTGEITAKGLYQISYE